MKNIKIHYILLLLFTATFLTSCYDDDEYWLDDNVVEGGKYYPVIQDFFVTPTSGETFTAGGSITTDLFYWSRDAVKNVRYTATYPSGTIIELGIFPYESAWNSETEAEELKKSFTLPSDAGGQEITIGVEVITEYDLVRSAKASITLE